MKFFFTAELSHFLGQKIQKNIFGKNIFLQKNIFLNFLSQKVTKFFSKKQNWKKIFFPKIILEKMFFL